MTSTPPVVPTVADLLVRGLARVVEATLKGQPTHYQLTAKGQQLVYDAMAARAAWFKVSP